MESLTTVLHLNLFIENWRSLKGNLYSSKDILEAKNQFYPNQEEDSHPSHQSLALKINENEANHKNIVSTLLHVSVKSKTVAKNV
jgi:hypothetical protein